METVQQQTSPEQANPKPKIPESLNQNPTKPKGESLDKIVSEQEALSGTSHTKNEPFSGFGNFGQSGNSTNSTGSTQGTGSTSLPLGILDGEFVLGLVDVLVPTILVAALYAMGTKVAKGKLQLSEREKSFISPILQKCLDSISLNFNNPWHALLLALGVTYGGKFVEIGVVQAIDKKMEGKKPESKEPAKVQEEIVKVPPPPPPPKTPEPFNLSEEQIMRICKKKRYTRSKAVDWVKKTPPARAHKWLVENNIINP